MTSSQIKAALTQAHADTAAAITQMGGTVNFGDGFSDFPADILTIPQGGPSPQPESEERVTFYDYDGTVVYNYTYAQAEALTELPALPTHTGLVALGWNWTLSEIKTQMEEAGGVVDVACNYDTLDQSTMLHITLPCKSDWSLKIELNQVSSNHQASIDWGDGTVDTNSDYISTKNFNHTYNPVSYPASYVIKIYSDVNYILGNGDSKCNMFTRYVENLENKYQGILTEANISSRCYKFNKNCFKGFVGFQKISLPSSIKLDTFSLYCNVPFLAYPRETTFEYYTENPIGKTQIIYPGNLTTFNYAPGYFLSLYTPEVSVTIPYGVILGKVNLYDCKKLSTLNLPSSYSGSIRISNNAGIIALNNLPENVTSVSFQNCTSLQSVTIPSSVTSIAANAFQGCTSLQSVTIPSSVTSIAASAFQGCTSLQSVTIPSSVTSIDSSAFQGCYSLASIYIPGSVTTINNQAFYRCYSMTMVDLTDFTDPAQLPTLSNINALSIANSDAYVYSRKIYVKNQTMFDAFSTATNWSTYANQMEIVV